MTGTEREKTNDRLYEESPVLPGLSGSHVHVRVKCCKKSFSQKLPMQFGQ
jgi:hypothetical protein